MGRRLSCLPAVPTNFVRVPFGNRHPVLVKMSQRNDDAEIDRSVCTILTPLYSQYILVFELINRSFCDYLEAAM